VEEEFVYTSSDIGDGSFGSVIIIAVVLLLIRNAVSPHWKKYNDENNNSLLKKLPGGILLPIVGLVACAISALRFPPLGIKPVENVAAIIMCLGLLLHSLKTRGLVNEGVFFTMGRCMAKINGTITAMLRIGRR
jgi:hypothetical protein